MTIAPVQIGHWMPGNSALACALPTRETLVFCLIPATAAFLLTTALVADIIHL
jgi:hypothetical protein